MCYTEIQTCIIHDGERKKPQFERLWTLGGFIKKMTFLGYVVNIWPLSVQTVLQLQSLRILENVWSIFFHYFW